MTLSAAAADRPSPFFGEAGAAVLATLAFLALHAALGFSTLTDAGGDNDSLLRLVEVRDLIAGQGWFDLNQHRMGAEDAGLAMHWSRLVDAPIAAIVIVGSAITGSMAWGETIALIAWPAMLFCAALYFLLGAASRFAGPATLFPAVIIGAAALHYIGTFAPGALDHHNVQLVLTVATVFFLLEASARDSLAFGAAAGACTALSLGIGMEAVPYVAAGGAVTALLFLFYPAGMRRAAEGFGLGFGGLSGAIFLATVPPSAWSIARCDAFSLPQFSAAALSGLGLAAIAANAALQASFTRRLAVLGGLAAGLAGVFAVLYPQCLADPYAGLDPRLHAWWLDAVTEAQPIGKVLSLDPAMAAGHYAMPLMGLICVVAVGWRAGISPAVAIVAAFLAAAFTLSVWQVRGSVFSIPLAVIPLSAFVAAWRLRAAGPVPAATTLKMAAAWLISFSVVWSAAAGGLVVLLTRNGPPSGLPDASATDACQDASVFAGLASLPATGVLVVSNLGAPVLRYTPHRVLAGPYHRNVEGNLAALDALTGPVATAREIVDRHRLTLVALCPGNDETKVFIERAPKGFLAALAKGDVPAWLQPIAVTQGQPLLLFRVAPQS